jgi:hypothetical protein
MVKLTPLTKITQSSRATACQAPVFRLPQLDWWRWFRILASVPCRASLPSAKFSVGGPLYFKRRPARNLERAIEFPASHQRIEFSHERHSFSLQLHHSFLVSCHSLNFELDWRFFVQSANTRNDTIAHTTKTTGRANARGGEQNAQYKDSTFIHSFCGQEESQLIPANLLYILYDFESIEFPVSSIAIYIPTDNPTEASTSSRSANSHTFW